MKSPGTYLCMALSADDYICSMPPLHDGPHRAFAGKERREVATWPNPQPIPNQENPHAR